LRRAQCRVLSEGATWLAGDDAAYRQRKREVEAMLLGRLRERLPELDDTLEICEVGTPRTMARYSWNPEGAIYGAASSPAQHPLRRPSPRTTLPGLYLAGAWTFPAGGFEGAMTSGLHTAHLVAHDLDARPSPF
jgi:prolycopene isomerase